MFDTLRTKINIPNRESTSSSQSSQTKLLSLLKVQNLDAFIDVLKSGLQSNQIDINYHYAHGTLLHIACRTKGCLKFVEILLEHGADVNAPHIKQSHKAAIHLAVENSNLEALQILMDHADCDVNSLTSYGDTALHYAVEYSSESRVIWLPRCDTVTYVDRIYQSDKSSIHSQQTKCTEWEDFDPEYVKLLLRHPAIDVNILNRNHRTPLHLAMRLSRRKVIQELLEHPDIDLDTQKDFKGYTCRQLLTADYPEFAERIAQIGPRTKKTIESLFTLLYQRDVEAIRARVGHRKPNSKHHDGKYTYLQYACNHGLVQIVEILLQVGIDPNQYSRNNPRTPLMIAAYRGDHVILQILLGHSTTSFEPVTQKTVLHTLFDGMFAIKNKQVGKHPEWNHLKCLEYLLKVEHRYKLDIHYADADGNTPLHYAVKLNDEAAVKALLRAGAFVGRKNLLGKIPLASISAFVLEDCLDNCVSTNGKHPKDDDYEIIFDYSFFTRPKSKKSVTNEVIDYNITEMEALLIMNNTSELRKLLKHPVLLSFLNLKWCTMAKYFYINLIFYFAFCVFLTIYIYRINDCIDGPNNSRVLNHSSPDRANAVEDKTVEFVTCKFPVVEIHTWYITLVLSVVLFLRELYQFYVVPRSYFKFAENWLEILLICMTFTLLFWDMNSEQRRQLSSATIMASWMELMLLIGRHPLSSTNIEMFMTVSLNFLKFLAWYSILILAFALSFYILFKDNTRESNQFFRNPFLSIIKSIIMLTGEFDAGAIPLFPFDYKSSASYILFVLFVFLVAIVLFNLLNGLAVSDTQAIRADAEIVGIVSRIKFTAYVETVAIVDRFSCVSLLHAIARYCAFVPYIHQAKRKRGEHLKIFYENANLLPYLFLENKISVLPNYNNIVLIDNFSTKLEKVGIWKKNLITRYCFRIDTGITKEAVKILDKNNQRREAAVRECICQSFVNHESRVKNVEKLLLAHSSRLESMDKSLKQIIDVLKSK